MLMMMMTIWNINSSRSNSNDKVCQLYQHFDTDDYYIHKQQKH